MARKKKHSFSSSQKVGIGVGLTAAAVTAAGAYFLYGSKNAAKNRKKVKSWMLKAKADVLETLENAEHITEQEYKQLIDNVLSAYGKARTLSKKDVKDFEREMKDHWGDIVKNGKQYVVEHAQAPAKQAAKKKATKKTAKKAAKKAAKKTAKKTAKKATKKAAKKTSKKK